MGDELEKHYTLKIDLFVKIDPQKFRLEYQGARDVILRKSIFSSRGYASEMFVGYSVDGPAGRAGGWPCIAHSRELFPFATSSPTHR